MPGRGRAGEDPRRSGPRFAGHCPAWRRGTGRRSRAAWLLPLLAACVSDNPAGPPAGTSVRPGLDKLADGLDFPLYLTAPAGDDRLFIVEKNGRIRVLKEGSLLTAPFLDLSGQVSTGGEQGLLSMAFHPDYAANGRFFVDFTNRAGDTRVVEFRVSGDPDIAEPQPVRAILEVEQPFSDHNGGLVLFGPDGKLYVGLGDGGAADDPLEAGQDKGTLLGAILRLDVDGETPFGVPPDNPFVDDPEARSEIWVYGLRNPWRFSFDHARGDFYVADVGQNAWEEVNAAAGAHAAGLNFGWDLMEGRSCLEPAGCDTTAVALPVVVYGRAEGCAVIGGYVYRGSALPDLSGTYFYSDFCSGFVRSFVLAGEQATGERSWPDLEPDEVPVVSFGEDAEGELYILTGAGAVYKIVPVVE